MHRLGGLLTAGILAAGLLAPGARAATITATYDFTGSPGNQASEAVDTLVGAGASFSDITRGSGLTASAAANSLSSSGFSTSASLTGDALNDYYELMITPEAGMSLSLDRLTFSARRSGTGPRTIEARGSIDGFATSVQIGLFGYAEDNTLTVRPDFDATGLNALRNLTAALTIRIFGYAAESSGGTFRLGATTPGAADNLNSLPSNLIVNASVSRPAAVVPEPGSIVLMGLGLVGAGCVAIRRRSRD